ncbi:AAA family ATPase [uncultured Parabacteroides sp.]|uniref:ATP-dependent nuclease n=1 Tax=uncultured Parabacteroides sp. TaxID=512312 RepID=UPI002805864C|nr:AAA family ATPase [uncultured Parabacteroides sp.]
MKLYKLIIKNFRGLKGEKNEIKYKESNILFLIGQNNVGKSTYLRAYEYFVNPKQVVDITDFYDQNTTIPIEMEGWFIKEEQDDEDDTYKLKDPEWVSKWANVENIIKIKKIWNDSGKSFEKYTYSPRENEWVKNGFGGFDSLFTNAAPEPIAINAMEDEKTLNEKVNKLMQDRYLKQVRIKHPDLYNGLIEKIQQLEKAIIGTTEIQKLNAELNKHFQSVFSNLSLRIEANNVSNIKIEDLFKKNHTINVDRPNVVRKESFLQNGHGIIRQALFNFVTFLKDISTGTTKEYLILYEEPELFLHPKVAFKLRECLYDLANNSPYQILCATHSPLMIDVSRPHSSLIRVVKDGNENTQTYQVGEDLFNKDEERKECVQMINRFNPHICEVFYADKVILVEGDTEAIVYRALLKHFYSNEEVFVLNTGSKNNIPFFQEILTAFRIEHYVIHDIDTEYNKDDRRNSAWMLNQKIGDLVEYANKVMPGLARRYVHNANFENAHKYKLLAGKNKPLQASKFVNRIISGQIVEPDCKKWLDDIMGGKKIVHDMNYINSIKKNFNDIKNDEKDYMSLDDENKIEK